MELKETIFEIYNALEEKGYSPDRQIVGFLISGDPTYITSYRGARNLANRLDTEKVLFDMVDAYFTAMQQPKPDTDNKG